MTDLCRDALRATGLAALSAIATADPLILDSEQKAASAVSAAIFHGNQIPGYSSTLSEGALDFAERALAIVRTATSLEVLLNTSAATMINCNIAGTVKVRMTDTLPRVLRLHWNDCVLNQYGTVRAYSGPMSIGLPVDNLRPERLTSVRLGNEASEFVEQLREEMVDQVINIAHGYRLALQGDMPTYRALPAPETGAVTGTYRIDGYSDYQAVYEFPDGRPQHFVTFKVSADRTRVKETTIVSETGTVDDKEIQWVSGPLVVVQSETGFGTATQSYVFDRYRVRQIVDYEAWTVQLAVNGDLEINWAPWWGTGGCMSGWYSFRTRTPLARNADSVVYDAGDLRVNDSVVARFYSFANVPSNLPAPVNGMLLNMRVQGLGVFNYDVATPSEALIPVGRCAL